jgi:hypothetical protein
VEFIDGPTVDLRDASYLAASSEAPEVIERLRIAYLSGAAARIRWEATVHPAGTARLTAGNGRSYAPAIGFLPGLIGGALITAGLRGLRQWAVGPLRDAGADRGAPGVTAHLGRGALVGRAAGR